MASVAVVGIALFFLLCCGGVASACEVVLTHAEIASDRSRAVVFDGPGLTSPTANLGFVVNGVGDVNGDGFNDFALAAPQFEPEFYAGAVFLVFGRNSSAWASASFNFSEKDTPDPASWVKISAVNGSTLLGRNGVASGDFNSDGLSDILISSAAGRAFCVFGHRGNWSSFITSDIKNGNAPGFVITGGNGTARYMGNAGDMNGDGIEDILVATGDDGPNTVFVVFGLAGSVRSSFDLGEINGTNGFSLFDGSELGYFRTSGSAGDVNGDGLPDLAVGSYKINADAGRAYVVFARNVSASDRWNNGFIVDGPISSNLGITVIGAGDVNADGFADVFIGSSSASGGAWIVFGHAAPWTSPFSATQLDGTNGFHFASETNEWWGYSGGGAGDVNGDGFDDVVIGGYKAQDSNGTATGAAAILFGHSGAWAAELGRNDAVGSVGFLIEGTAEGNDDSFGLSTLGAGDVNGDGLADVVMGAPYYFSFAGYAALVFGVADDHCAVCSNITNACLVCKDGFILNGTFCEAAPPVSSNGESSVAVVVIETGSGGSSAVEVAKEVAQLLGVDASQISVSEITPGTFEVTVTSQDVALQLVTLIEQCMDDAESGQL